MTTVEKITQMMATLRAETTDAATQLQQQQQQQEAAAASLAAAMARTVAVEQIVTRLQAKLDEKKEHGKGRDLFISKRASQTCHSLMARQRSMTIGGSRLSRSSRWRTTSASLSHSLRSCRRCRRRRIWRNGSSTMKIGTSNA